MTTRILHSTRRLCRSIVYSVYASTLRSVVLPALDLDRFAYDHLVNTSFKAKDQNQKKHCITNLKNCSASINDWMNQNRLKNELGESKVYTVLFPKTSTILHNRSYKHMWRPSPQNDKIKLLGTWLLSNLNLKHHINLKCRMGIQKLKHIINVLIPDAARLIVIGTITSHINYAKVLYYALPESIIKKLP